VPFGGTLPSQILPLSDFYLTLPTGSAGNPDTVQQPALATYTSRYFQVNTAGDGVIFTAPTTGVHTKDSKYARSELRQTNPDGSLASWDTGSGTHAMTLTEAILQLPQNKPDLIFAQIHGRGSKPFIMLEAYGSNGGTSPVRLAVKGALTGTIDPAYHLGDRFNLVLSTANNVATITYNGKVVVSGSASQSGAYFKAGSYCQSNESGTSTCQVGIYSLGVS
jgi:hypothetical protein